VWGCEDWDLWVRLAAEGVGLVPVPHIGAIYRLAPGSMSTKQLRMLESRARILVRAHRLFAQKPDLLRRWGSYLRELLCRLLRECLVRKTSRTVPCELARSIHELETQGFPIERSFKRRLLVNLLGELAVERLTLAYYRRFDPTSYRRYANH
jgi:hypothetical protein